MKKLILLSSAALLIGGMMFYGCKKKTDELVGSDTDTQTAVDNEVGEGASKDAGNMCSAAYKAKQSGKPDFRVNDSSFAKGAVIDTGTVNGSHFINCDFGVNGVFCGDGVWRYGKLHAKWSDVRSYDSSGIKVIDFIGYKYRSYKISGTVTITKDIINTPKKTRVQADVHLQKSGSADTSTLVSDVTQELIDDKGTPNTITDNIYQLTGSSHGTNSKGTAYSQTITKPLIKDMTCPWFMEGTIKYTISGKTDRYLDFGSRTQPCHSIDTLTIGANKFVVKFDK